MNGKADLEMLSIQVKKLVFIQELMLNHNQNLLQSGLLDKQSLIKQQRAELMVGNVQMKIFKSFRMLHKEQNSVELQLFLNQLAKDCILNGSAAMTAPKASLTV